MKNKPYGVLITLRGELKVVWFSSLEEAQTGFKCCDNQAPGCYESVQLIQDITDELQK